MKNMAKEQWSMKMKKIIIPSSQFLLTLCIFILFFNNILYADDDAGIIITKQSFNNSGIVTFNVSVKNFPKQIDSLGLDIKYDPLSLKFNDYLRGKLVENFDFFKITNNKENGIVRIGGFEAGLDKIAKGTTGNIAVLNFEVLENTSNTDNTSNTNDNINLDLTNLKDDLNPLLSKDEIPENNQENPKTETQIQSNLQNNTNNLLDENNQSVINTNTSDLSKNTNNSIFSGNKSISLNSKETQNNNLSVKETTNINSNTDFIANNENIPPVKTTQKKSENFNNAVYNINEKKGFQTAQEISETTSQESNKYNNFQTIKFKKRKINKSRSKIKNKKTNSAASLKQTKNYLPDILSQLKQTNKLLGQTNSTMEEISLEIKNIKKENYKIKIIIFVLVLVFIYGLGGLVFFINKINEISKKEKKGRVKL